MKKIKDECSINTNRVSLYCLFDKVAKTFYAPTVFKNDEVAKRAFGELMLSDRYAKSKHDYELYCVGSFNDFNGFVVPLERLNLICKGSDFVAENS